MRNFKGRFNPSTNKVEQEIQDLYPGVLVRVPVKKSEPHISVLIRKEHYPDFKMFHPEHGAGLWIEVKGYVQNDLFIPTIRDMDAKDKQYYCVLVVDTSPKGAKLVERLTKLGVRAHQGKALPKEWIELALTLYKNYVSKLHTP